MYYIISNYLHYPTNSKRISPIGVLAWPGTRKLAEEHVKAMKHKANCFILTEKQAKELLENLQRKMEV